MLPPWLPSVYKVRLKSLDMPVVELGQADTMFLRILNNASRSLACSTDTIDLVARYKSVEGAPTYKPIRYFTKENLERHGCTMERLGDYIRVSKFNADGGEVFFETTHTGNTSEKANFLLFLKRVADETLDRRCEAYFYAQENKNLVEFWKHNSSFMLNLSSPALAISILNTERTYRRQSTLEASLAKRLNSSGPGLPSTSDKFKPPHRSRYVHIVGKEPPKFKRLRILEKLDEESEKDLRQCVLLERKQFNIEIMSGEQLGEYNDHTISSHPVRGRVFHPGGGTVDCQSRHAFDYAYIVDPVYDGSPEHGFAGTFGEFVALEGAAARIKKYDAFCSDACAYMDTVTFEDGKASRSMHPLGTNKISARMLSFLDDIGFQTEPKKLKKIILKMGVQDKMKEALDTNVNYKVFNKYRYKIMSKQRMSNAEVVVECFATKIIERKIVADRKKGIITPRMMDIHDVMRITSGHVVVGNYTRRIHIEESSAPEKDCEIPHGLVDIFFKNHLQYIGSSLFYPPHTFDVLVPVDKDTEDEDDQFEPERFIETGEFTSTSPEGFDRLG